MIQTKTKGKLIRYSLGSLLLLLAINAFGGGFYGVAGAKNVPLEWLDGSPFRNYIIPGIILIRIVGGSALVSAIMVFKKHHLAKKASMISGIIVIVWIIIQILIIGYVSVLQL